jgi:hypothetical protein
MLIFLRYFPFSYRHGQVQESAGYWREVRYTANSDAPDGLRRTEGLGFEVTMSQYGYPWFLEKVDWGTMTFAPLMDYISSSTIHLCNKPFTHGMVRFVIFGTILSKSTGYSS